LIALRSISRRHARRGTARRCSQGQIKQTAQVTEAATCVADPPNPPPLHLNNIEPDRSELPDEPQVNVADIRHRRLEETALSCTGEVCECQT